MVTARFECDSIRVTQYSHEVSMGAVISSGPDSPNASCAKATPSGRFTMAITNPDAYDQFEPGVVYQITIDRAEPPS